MAFVLSESRPAAAHYLALADEFGTEFRTIQGEVDVEVNAVECSLWGVHPLKVLLQILA